MTEIVGDTLGEFVDDFDAPILGVAVLVMLFVVVAVRVNDFVVVVDFEDASSLRLVSPVLGCGNDEYDGVLPPRR